MSKSNKKNSFTIEVDSTELSPAHMRMLRTFNGLMVELLSTKSETDYFNQSAEVLRICASLIQQASFIEQGKEMNNIPYSSQVLEFSMDILQEHMQKANVTNWDN